MTIRPLLNRRPLWPDESLSSLFVRLNAVNHYVSSMAVEAICRSHLSQADSLPRPILPHTWHVISTVTGLSKQSLYAATCHRFADKLVLPSDTTISLPLPSGSSLPLLPTTRHGNYLLPLSDCQFCPHCLAHQPYHRIFWSLAPLTVCMTHHCLLLRGCPHCQQPLSATALVLNLCPSCATVLSRATSHFVHESSQLTSQYVLQHLLTEASIPLSMHLNLPPQPTPILMELLRGLATLSVNLPVFNNLPYRPDSGQPKRRHPAPRQLYMQFDIAIQSLVDWPTEFHHFLQRYSQRLTISTGEITKLFAVLYSTWLEKKWDHPEFAFVQSAFNAFLVANFPLSRPISRLQRYRQNAAFRDLFPELMELEAAEKLGTYQLVIRRLVAVGFLRGENRVLHPSHHGHRGIRVVRRIDFETFRERWQIGVPLADLCKFFALSLRMVHALIAANFFTLSVPLDEISDVSLVEFSSLLIFLNQLVAFHSLPYDAGDVSSLNQFIVEGYDWIAILRIVFDKHVPAVWYGDELLDLIVERSVIAFLPS